jgi:hypothetical protein
MRRLNGAHKLLMCQQLQQAALLLLVLTLSASLPALGLSSEVFKYGDEPEHAGNSTGTHWTYGEQDDASSRLLTHKRKLQLHLQEAVGSSAGQRMPIWLCMPCASMRSPLLACLSSSEDTNKA